MTGVILAAGRSARMNSSAPKVLLSLNGRPILSYVLKTAKDSKLKRIIIVVGRDHKKVKTAFANESVEFVRQKKPSGTADAVRTCQRRLADKEEILIFCGDTPLLTAGTVRKLVKIHQKRNADATLLTAVLAKPKGYGRILRDNQNQIQAIIEEREAKKQTKKIKEVNAGVYVFRWEKLAPILKKLKPSKTTGEYYLTDVISMMRERGATIASYITPRPSEMLGVNTLADFNRIKKILNQKSAKK
ncbi:MAG: NTP transferase domain-containing protein [bacterium]